MTEKGVKKNHIQNGRHKRLEYNIGEIHIISLHITNMRNRPKIIQVCACRKNVQMLNKQVIRIESKQDLGNTSSDVVKQTFKCNNTIDLTFIDCNKCLPLLEMWANFRKLC